MSDIFIATKDGRARELTISEWLDLWAALPLQVSAAVEAGMIIALDGAQIWKRS